jgi:hypothetical protein
MGKKIKLLGVRDLITDETIRPQRDYGITMTASRISEEVEDDDPEAITYKMRVERIDGITDLRESRPVAIEKGRTKSQKLRYLVENKLGKEEYQYYMDWLMSNIEKHTEEYLDYLQSK